MTWEEACCILGVSITATPAEIEAQWLYKANLLHPDRTAHLPENMRKKSEEDFKQASAAHDFLKDSKNNPYTTPPKLEASIKHIRFKDLEPGQKKSTSFVINNIGGPYTKFWIDDAPAPWLRVTSIKSTTNESFPLEVTIEATGMGQPGQQAQCSLLIRLENEETKFKDEWVILVEVVTRKVRKPKLEPGSEICPQDNSPLLFDTTVLLWKCPRCKRVYTAQDLHPSPPAGPKAKQHGFLQFIIICLIVVSIIAGYNAWQGYNAKPDTPSYTYTNTYTTTRPTVTLPLIPTAITPGSASSPGPIITTLTPTLQWVSVYGADYYTIGVFRWINNAWSAVYNPQLVYTNTVDVPSGILVSSGQYTWNLRAHYSSGWSSTSNSLYFQTQALPTPTITTTTTAPSTTTKPLTTITTAPSTPTSRVDENGFMILTGFAPPYTLGGFTINPVNNPAAKDPTFSQMVAFLNNDKTDEKDYSTTYTRLNYAEEVHDNAETAGIRCAVVFVELANDIVGYFNAFNTTDKGLYFIDCVGESAEQKKDFFEDKLGRGVIHFHWPSIRRNKLVLCLYE